MPRANERTPCVPSFTLAALVLVSLLTAGCPHRFDPPADAITDPAVLLAGQAARSGGVRSLVAEARVEYYGDDGVRKGRVIVAAQRPQSVRFEALTPSRDFLAILVSDGDSFVSFERGRSRCWTGPACPVNVGRLLPIALPPAAVVEVLLGGVPLLADADSSMEFDRETGSYVLTQRSAARDERLRATFDPADLRPRSVRVMRGNRTLFRVHYLSPTSVNGVRVPQRVEFAMPDRNVDLSLEYRDLEVNPNGLTADAFTFECPKGVERWRLECDGTPPRPTR